MPQGVDPNNTSGGTGPGGESFWFETLAQMTASPGPAIKESAWNAETDATYEWFPGNIEVVDNWTIISQTGGTNGRWILKSSRISILPIGGAVDDWPRLFSAIKASVDSVHCCYLEMRGDESNPWHCDSIAANPGVTTGAGTIPNNADVRGASEQKVCIISTLTPTGGGGHAIACFSRNNLGFPSNTTTLTSNVAKGSTVIPVASTTGMFISTPQNPCTISLGFGTNQCQSYTVVNIVGLNVTIDRPTVVDFPSATTGVGVFDEPRNIKISNLTFVGGTGDRAISLVSGWNCLCKDITLLSPRFSDYQLSYDTSQRFSKWQKITIIDTIFPGIAIEGGEGSAMEDIEIIGCGSADTAIVISASYDGTVERAQVRKSFNCGIHVGFTIDNIASRGNRIISSSFIGNGIGAAIDGGSQDEIFTDCEFSYNSNYGLYALPGTGATPTHIYLNGFRFIGNGIHILADTSNDIRGILGHMEDSINAAVQTQNGADVWLEQITLNENVCQYALTNLSRMHIDKYKFTSTNTTLANGTFAFRSVSPATYMSIGEGTCEFPANKGVVLSQGSGTVIIGDTVSTGGLYGLYVGGLGSAATCHMRAGIDVSSTPAANQLTADVLGVIVRDDQMSGLASGIAISVANITLTWAQHQKGMGVYTGVMTAGRNAIYPPIIGHIWTARNDNASVFNLTVIGPSGTGVAIAPTLTVRFYWDGTNMVAA